MEHIIELSLSDEDLEDLAAHGIFDVVAALREADCDVTPGDAASLPDDARNRTRDAGTIIASGVAAALLLQQINRVLQGYWRRPRTTKAEALEPVRDKDGNVVLVDGRPLMRWERKDVLLQPTMPAPDRTKLDADVAGGRVFRLSFESQA